MEGPKSNRDGGLVLVGRHGERELEGELESWDPPNCRVPPEESPFREFASQSPPQNVFPGKTFCGGDDLAFPLKNVFPGKTFFRGDVDANPLVGTPSTCTSDRGGGASSGK